MPGVRVGGNGPSTVVKVRRQRGYAPVSRRRLRLRVLGLLLIFAVGLPGGLIGVFRVARPPLTPYMAFRVVAEGAPLDYRWRGLGAMSPHILRAVIAAEDTRFMQHNGFDWTEVESAVRESRHGRRLRGASTISMQCARALFLWPGRSVVRKALEAYLTVLLEALWPKQRILEVYLNVVEWGDGVYGCEAAAEHSLHTSCADLDPEQAARLAAILPNPRRWSAAHPGRYVRKRIATVLERMPLVAVPRRSD
jgi:monofunctional biosynthetic peptidoglycan transglycosylase